MDVQNRHARVVEDAELLLQLHHTVEAAKRGVGPGLERFKTPPVEQSRWGTLLRALVGSGEPWELTLRYRFISALSRRLLFLDRERLARERRPPRRRTPYRII